MTNMPPGREAFAIDRVIRRTFEQFSTPVGRAGLLATLIVYALTAIYPRFLTQGGSGLYFIGLVTALVGVVVWIIINAILVRAITHNMMGAPESWSDEIAASLRKFWPLIALGLLQGLAIALGVVLLVVPGIILGIMWCVTQQALLIEGRSVFDCFSRSAQLTQGYRWRILAVMAIFILGAMVLGGIGGVVSFVVTTGGAGLIGSIIQSLVQGAIAFVGIAGLSATYVELLRAKEGLGDQTAEIFS